MMGGEARAAAASRAVSAAFPVTPYFLRGTSVHFPYPRQVSSISSSQAVMDGRVAKLESEIAALRQLIQSTGIMPAAGGVSTRGH